MYFLFIVLIAFDYYLLTCNDPADILLLHPDKVQLFQTQYQNYQKKELIPPNINNQQ